MIRRFDLVAFDVDGTLVHHPEDKTVWEVLNHRFTGSEDQNVGLGDFFLFLNSKEKVKKI